MRKHVITSFLAVTLFTLSTACSPEEGYKRPKVWPKPTDPPPASPIYHDVAEKMPSEQDIERAAAERNALLESELERALMGDDIVQRETVLVYVLPELLQVEPKRVTDLHARLQGEPRDILRTEIAQRWASSDPSAAAGWFRTLEERERRSAAVTAVTTLAPWEPGAALQLADEFDLEKDETLRQLLGPPRGPLVDAAMN